MKQTNMHVQILTTLKAEYHWECLCMAKICAVDNKKIGAMTGFVKLEGGFICRPHWKQAGLNTTSDPVKYSEKISASQVVDALNRGINLKDELGQTETARLDEIKKQFEDAGVSDLWGTKKEVSALPELLNDDETVKYATSGLVDGNTVLMVCTDERIIFIDKGMVYGIKSTEIPLDMVNSVNYEKGMLMGSISIVNGAVKTEVKNVMKETAPKMIDAIKSARKEFMHPSQNNSQSSSDKPAKSITDQLHELKSLVDEGNLTQDEFNAKKKQLLNI